MSAITHAHAYIRTTPSHNPPLALNPRAILSQLQHFATNGPQYVQFQATRSLARIVGLFDRASDAIRELGFGPTDDTTEPEQPQQPEELKLVTSDDEITKEDDDYL
ncbi:MAG: hypothetical protein OXT70_14695 [Chloroflexota bacterium]|nr:hypothetical protein [Chloroflexota bacterium]